MTVDAPSQRWTVVLPVKHATRAKSRLGPVAGPALARAIALDTIDAVAACAAVERVVVATDDGELEAAARAGAASRSPASARVDFMADRAAAGPDAAIVAAMATIPDSTSRAALLADLPALRPSDLGAALALAASEDRGVVPDAESTGSTLVTAAPGIPWLSAFGPASFERHVALGCTPLDVPAGSSLRRDVDTPAHLAAAVALGLGPRTAAVLRAP